jgi:putative ABC transport system permease protein
VSPPLEKELAAELRYISPNYFSVLRIPLQRGRDFSIRDKADSTRVMIINRTLARRLWPHGMTAPPVIRVPELEAGPAWQVVGVVADVRDNGLLAEPPPTVYIPVEQVSQNPWHWTGQSMFVVARTQANPALFIRPVEKAVHRVDPDLPLGDVATMEDRLANSTNTAELYSFLLVLLGVSGLILTAGGIYGVVAYFVSRQTQEIGIRIALGASSSRILVSIFRQAMRPVVLGITLGLALSLALMPTLSAQVYGINSQVPMTTLAAVLAVVATALVACYLPARRAARVDPIIAIRDE